MVLKQGKTVRFLCCLGFLSAVLAALPQRDKTAPLQAGITPDADSLPLMVLRDEGFFAAEEAGGGKLEELQGKGVVLSTDTIIQYTVEAQTEAAGTSPEAYETIPVPRMFLQAGW
jgi:hypothetical protein